MIEEGKYNLRKRLFRIIIIYVLAGILLTVLITVIQTDYMREFAIRSGQEKTDTIVESVKSGFYQSDMAFYASALELMREVPWEEGVSPTEQLRILCERASVLPVFDQEAVFMVKDAQIIAAVTAPEFEETDPEALRETIRDKIESNPEGMNYADATCTERDTLKNAAQRVDGIMAFDSSLDDSPMMDIIKYTDEYMIGIYSDSVATHLWANALSMLVDDNEQENAQRLESIMLRSLLLCIGVYLVLGAMAILSAVRATNSIAEPVEKDGLEKAKRLRQSEREKKALYEADKLKSESMANISHELKTPLTIVSGYAQESRELLMTEPDEDGLLQVEKNMKVIVAEANRLALMVSQVMDASAIDEGRFFLNTKEISPTMLIQDILNTYYPVLSNNGNTIKFEKKSKVSSLICDMNRIRQVLINLMVNASRHTKNGTITVRTLDTDDGIRFEIEDTGAGISPEALPHIFDRYYKDETGKSGERNTGTGLGLYISKRIVEAHEGTIDIRSTLGEGTVIGFTIPMKSELSKTYISSPV